MTAVIWQLLMKILLHFQIKNLLTIKFNNQKHMKGSGILKKYEPVIDTAPRLTHPMISRSKSGAIKPKSPYVGLTKSKHVELDLVLAKEAVKIPCWRRAMEQEYEVLVS